jgi:alpha-mannosidase
MISHVNRRRGIFLSLLLMVIALIPTPGVAQRDNIYDQAASRLPAQARAVVDRLSSLTELPDGAWRMHVGDIPHGEAVNLDDSGWQSATVGSHSPDAAVWFRRTIEVPQTLHGYDLTGARIWFQFRDTAHGPATQILYFNGRRVAMGEDLEPTVLFDGAHPGEKAVVAVKVLETVGEKTFRGATMRIDFAENRPNPNDLRQEFLSAAVLLPSLAPGDAAKETTLEDAIKPINEEQENNAGHPGSRFQPMPGTPPTPNAGGRGPERCPFTPRNSKAATFPFPGSAAPCRA